MDTTSGREQDEHGSFTVGLDVISKTANGVNDLSLPELRRQLDRIHAFVAKRFIPHCEAEVDEARALINRLVNVPPATGIITGDQAEVKRLAAKLLALRERLLFSYFGPNQLESLREVLYDLHTLIKLHLATEDEFNMTLLDQAVGQDNVLVSLSQAHAAR
jgi:hypothetical protein